MSAAHPPAPPPLPRSAPPGNVTWAQEISPAVTFHGPY
jgi:hypothetical protein